jgi:uncharacterized metal-binding protein YceD (DUF177 family)
MMAPAMNTRPQAALPYLELARQAARITRQIELKELSRLEELVVEDGSPTPRSETVLTVDLQFGVASDGQVRVQGEIRGDIGLLCHGCAEALPYHLSVEFDGLIVGSDEAARLLDAQAPSGGRPEAVIVADGRDISLAEIVEDEILLALPERLCRTEPCEWAPGLVYPAGSATDIGHDAGDEGAGPERDNPFSVLADLTTKKTTPTG